MKKLEARVEALTEKNEDLTQQILKAHAAESKRMIILLRQLPHAPGPSF